MNSLSKLSNQELESRLKDLASKERQLLHVILEHIKEFNTRKLYLERAYSSIYEYLIKELGYSGSAAMRRIEAAKLLRDLPEVSEKIQEGSLNLSQIGELSRAIKEKEKAAKIKVSAQEKLELVAKISGKTTRETQKELSQALDIELKQYDTQRVHKDESVRLETTVSKEFYEKLLKCKDLAAHKINQKNQDPSWSAVLEVLADQYLAANSIAPKVTKTKNANIKKSVFPVTDAVLHPGNKTLTPKTKKEILNRDQCCQFKDSISGKQCKSTYALQTDHKTSRWAGGKNSQTNLQVLCAGHNRHKYRKESQMRFI